MIDTLFIGGSMDGKRKNFSYCRPIHRIALVPELLIVGQEPRPEDFATEDYRLMTILIGNVRRQIYIENHVSDYAALMRLISNYNPQP